SEQTKMAYGGEACLVDYLSHPLGAFRALMESHRPVRVLTEYALECNDLQGVRELVLPNVACLSDRAAGVIRRFVRGGGGVVATFETSLFDPLGARRSDFVFVDLFRAAYAGTTHVLAREAAISLYVAGPHPVTADPAVERGRWTSGIDPTH